MSFPQIHKGPMTPKTLENYQEAFCMPTGCEIFQLYRLLCSLFFLLRSHLLVPGTVKLEEVAPTVCLVWDFWVNEGS